MDIDIGCVDIDRWNNHADPGIAKETSITTNRLSKGIKSPD